VIDAASALEVLRDGEIQLVGRLIGSTNHAMLARVTRICPPPDPPQTIEAVYKPTAGERPLDDFPDGTLSRREVAAYLVSEATGWGIVPPTVLREGPFGEGALQAWIDVDEGVDVVGMVLGDDPRLRRIAVFDAAVNNTDRKAGHLRDLGVILDRDVRMQRYPHENRCAVEHPRDRSPVAEAIAVLVVAAVVKKQRIQGIEGKPPCGVSRGHGPGLTAVAGLTGATVAAERLTFEELLALGRLLWKCPC